MTALTPVADPDVVWSPDTVDFVFDVAGKFDTLNFPEARNERSAQEHKAAMLFLATQIFCPLPEIGKEAKPCELAKDPRAIVLAFKTTSMTELLKASGMLKEPGMTNAKQSRVDAEEIDTLEGSKALLKKCGQEIDSRVGAKKQLLQYVFASTFNDVDHCQKQAIILAARKVDSSIKMTSFDLIKYRVSKAACAFFGSQLVMYPIAAFLTFFTYVKLSKPVSLLKNVYIPLLEQRLSRSDILAVRLMVKVIAFSLRYYYMTLILLYIFRYTIGHRFATARTFADHIIRVFSLPTTLACKISSMPYVIAYKVGVFYAVNSRVAAIRAEAVADERMRARLEIEGAKAHDLWMRILS